jgi:hypothetical protein
VVGFPWRLMERNLYGLNLLVAVYIGKYPRQLCILQKEGPDEWGRAGQRGPFYCKMPSSLGIALYLSNDAPCITIIIIKKSNPELDGLD